MPAMATGTFEFVHNVRVPGMLHGAWSVRPPVGATLVSVDESSVARLAGRGEGRRRERTSSASSPKSHGRRCRRPRKLKVDVDATAPALPSQRDFYDYLRKQPSRDTFVVNSRDVDETLANAAPVVKATYLHPYQMHGSMGTSCAVADVQGNKATIWSPTQSAYPTRSGVAMLLGLPPTTCASSSCAVRAATASTAPTRCRTTRRCCRRRSASRCACSCRARTRWRGRTTASPT